MEKIDTAATSYSNEGLVVEALFETYAADHGRVSALGLRE